MDDKQLPGNGFFIAEKQADGSPGRPLGNEDGAIMLFDDLDTVRSARDTYSKELGHPLSIFKIAITPAGEVIL